MNRGRPRCGGFDICIAFDALATEANAVLGNYKAHRAMVLKTDSVPRTTDRPAEHLIGVVLAQQSFVEVAFVRFKQIDGGGCSSVYSHRIYGVKLSEQTSA